MKVVLINTVCGKSGSVGRITAELLNYAEKNGIDCYAAYGRGKAYGINPQRGIPVGGRVSFYTDIALSRLNDRAGFNSSFATKRLLKKLDEISPDVIHLHNVHGYYINARLLFNYIRERNVKLVWTLHDCWSFTGHCAYFSVADCQKWKTGCYSCPIKNQYPKSYVDRSKRNYVLKKDIFTSLKRENVIIAVPSVWLKERVKESFLKDYTVEVIPNGVDISTFKLSDADGVKNKFAARGEKIVLGVTNVWDERKGFSDFISLAEGLPEYSFVGIGKRENEKHSLPNNMTWIYRTEDAKELAEYYSAADAFVNPTYDDNYPTTHMEAQCCGTAVVAYNVGGCGENIITPYGQCVEKGNISALTAAVKKACEEGYNKEELSLTAEKLFDKNESYGRYINLYKRIIKA